MAKSNSSAKSPPRTKVATAVDSPSSVTAKDQGRTSVSEEPEPEDHTPLYFLIGAHVLAATLAPIQDCDEVFNFYEPSHYLNHGYGLQTWELSPQFAIRSWLYAAIHAAGIYLGSCLPFQSGKIAEFYLCRGFLAASCATCEYSLYRMMNKYLNTQAAYVFLAISMTSTGMFHASVSYLPSSFAMASVILAMSAILDREKGSQIVRGMTFFAIGTVIGWPFVAVLAVPFVLEELISSARANEFNSSIKRLGQALFRCISILGAETFVDSYFYKKRTSAPINLALYNVFARAGKGPNIYGTEPWHFYIRNLLLNYNLWFVLAMLAGPLVLLERAVGKKAFPQLTQARLLAFISPLYLWLAIFTIQPHKEERFMYPIYPSIAFNASVSAYILFTFVIKFDRQVTVRGVPASLNTMLLGWLLLCGHIIGIWRSAGLVTAYRAPMKVYEPLFKLIPPASADNHAIAHVCIGKEWYRFPSSYHLPNNARLKFVQSDFKGLLPGEFIEDTSITLKDFGVTKPKSQQGRWPGTFVLPQGMNDMNIEDSSKYTDIDGCVFMIDSYLPSAPPSPLQPNYINDTATWEKVECRPFLDAAATRFFGRLFWVPETDLITIPEQFQRKWGEYCLLRRKKDQPDPVPGA